MNFRTRLSGLNEEDKEHLRYVTGPRPRTRTNVVAGLRESRKIQGGKLTCPGCRDLLVKLGIEYREIM